MRLLLFFCAITFCSLCFAQDQKNRISGTVTADKKNKLEAATVLLLNAKDSALIRTVVSDKEGSFGIANVKDGSYLLKVSAAGYKEVFTAPLLLDTSNNSVSGISIDLSPSVKTLQNVSVQTKKPFIEQKIDRTVVNVDASISNVGATALEVLEKSPGVTVDKDGNISLKGKSGVTILVDGKQTYLSGPDLANLLKTMNANQLDQVEIMTNPSAKYDAAGNSGIINLKTKKNKAKGWNGNVNLGYGQGAYAKTNNSLNLNYRNNKFNVFMNYGFRQHKGFQDLQISRNYYDAGKNLTGIFMQPTHMTNSGSNNNVKMGIDYTVNKRTSIGLVATAFSSPNRFDGFSSGFSMNPDSSVNRITTSANSNKDKWENKTVNINFSHKFDSTGTELTADADYLTYSNLGVQNFENNQYDNNWNHQAREQIKGLLPVDINIYSAKTDFSKTFKKGLKFEAGWKSSFVSTDNSSDYFNYVNNNWEPDYGKSNHFTYKENINAAYVNVNRQYKKLGVQAGLRFENTNYRGLQFGNPLRNDSSFSHTYAGLFPTLFLNYKVSEKNQFTMSVGRRIDRPGYQDLNPFLYYINKYTYMQGNPFLKPQYSRNIEVSHIYNNKLTTAVNYSITNDFFTGVFRTKNDTTILTRGNLSTRKTLGISINAEIPVQKWWNVSLNVNASNKKVNGFANGDFIRSDAESYSVNANNRFTLNKGWSMELSGFYNSLDRNGQFTIQPFGQLSGGIAKQLFNNKATLKLNVRDIFNSTSIDGAIKYQNVTEHFYQSHEAPVFNLGFTWRFGKAAKDNQKKGNSTAEEQGRVRVG